MKALWISNIFQNLKHKKLLINRFLLIEEEWQELKTIIYL